MILSLFRTNKKTKNAGLPISYELKNDELIENLTISLQFNNMPKRMVQKTFHGSKMLSIPRTMYQNKIIPSVVFNQLGTNEYMLTVFDLDKDDLTKIFSTFLTHETTEEWDGISGKTLGNNVFLTEKSIYQAELNILNIILYHCQSLTEFDKLVQE